MDRNNSALEILHKGTVIPAIPLALNKDRKFDEKHQRALCRYYLDAGVEGIAVAVHTTQFEIRNPEFNLFRPVLSLVAEEISKYEAKAGKVIVRIAGVCGNVEQAVKEAGIAKELGYDAVLLSPGGLQNLTEEQMLERTSKVAGVMPVIGFYLQTSVGGRKLSFDYWKALSNIDNVVAIKAAPFNRYQTIDLVRGVASSERADKIALYTGNDDNIVVDLLTKYVFNIDGKEIEKRFVGGLLGHWSVWTHSVVKMYNELKQYAGNEKIPAQLLTLAIEVTDANAAFFDAENGFAGCIAGIHEVLRRQGLLEGTWCLNPNEKMSAGQSEEIDRVYKMYPNLNDDNFVKANLLRWLI